jgi:hypothetical protein
MRRHDLPGNAKALGNRFKDGLFQWKSDPMSAQMVALRYLASPC